jgi:hypothetical protein
MHGSLRCLGGEDSGKDKENLGIKWSFIRRR